MNGKTNEMVWKVDGNHVYPVDDLREHVVTDCWCGPVEDDGIVVHNCLDGREMYERGVRKMAQSTLTEPVSQLTYTPSGRASVP